MGYGATSASLLLLMGVAPSMASASLHLSEIATTAASGVSHIRFGNVDRSIVYRLVAPGAVGAFLGAAALSQLPGSILRPYISGFLFLMGCYILYRYISRQSTPAHSSPLTRLYLTPLGLIAGFLDAVGGGGWGPVTTPMLVARHGTTPRKVIGSVDTSEFVIALSASLGFLLFLGWGAIDWFLVATFTIGGIFAAPLAAWFVKILPTKLMGLLVGGIIMVTNAATLVHSLHPLW